MKHSKLFKEIKQQLKDLATKTNKTKQSQFFKNYLNTLSKFYNYSYYNQLLILKQYPKATKVAGYKTWKQLGRNVIKGKKAIKILAPFKRKIEKDEETKLITYFYPVNVFDIKQTEGKPLHNIDISIKGEDKQELFNKLLEFCKERQIEVKFKELKQDLYGYSTGGSIVISKKESINMQTSTLIHEIAHELLHKESKLSKQQKEIQAEATAYVVSKHFGLETKSFNYLALYDANYKRIMENLKAVSGCVRMILGDIKEKSNR